jgi:hypothetical protein
VYVGYLTSDNRETTDAATPPVGLACPVARLDAVRIKVALTHDAAARAVSALGLIPAGERAVFFCEQVGATAPDLPLYDRGLWCWSG